jgi:hypothetical protein
MNALNITLAKAEQHIDNNELTLAGNLLASITKEDVEIAQNAIEQRNHYFYLTGFLSALNLSINNQFLAHIDISKMVETGNIGLASEESVPHEIIVANNGFLQGINHRIQCANTPIIQGSPLKG